MPSSTPSSALPGEPSRTTTAPAATPADGAALHLRADGISFSYPDRRVLTDISLVVPAGRPTGLLGENGSGKSTLLSVLAGRLVPDAGTWHAPGPVGKLDQELDVGPETTLGQVHEDALERSRRLEQELTAAAEQLAAPGDDQQRAAAARRYDELLTAAALADVWDAPRRGRRVLDGLGLGDVEDARPVGTLSGGQRGRLALAHLLIARPTTLLLDEPTNHLDDDGARFLAAQLAEHPGPVLVASHDRAFLDEATAAQLDLDPAPSPLQQEPGGLTAYTGTFTDYLHARMDARERWEKQFRDEQEELRRLETAVRENHTVGHEGRPLKAERGAAKKFFADRNAAVVSRRVRDAERRLEQLRTAQIRKPPQELRFTGMGERRRLPGGVLAAAGAVAVRDRLRPTSLALSGGEKLLITGANGSGKSTLLALLDGSLAPDAGTVTVTADRALLAQDEEVDEDALVRDVLGHGDEEREADLMGLVHPRETTRRMGELSRGQQRRVALAALLRRPPALLLLDEPTNHLSLDLATRLERAVQDWGGAVVIASHDRWLRRRWRGRTLELA